MSCNGAGDPWPNCRLQETVEMLKNRYIYWDRQREDDMDVAVRAMVWAVIRIGEEELKDREQHGYIIHDIN